MKGACGGLARSIGPTGRADRGGLKGLDHLEVLGSLCESFQDIHVTKALESFGVGELACLATAKCELGKLRERRRWCRALQGP